MLGQDRDYHGWVFRALALVDRPSPDLPCLSVEARKYATMFP
jgi:hypothetical protein